MKTSVELEKSAALQVAALMAAAARTAPKTCGIGNIKIAAIDDEPTKQKVISKMREIATKESRPASRATPVTLRTRLCWWSSAWNPTLQA